MQPAHAAGAAIRAFALALLGFSLYSIVGTFGLSFLSSLVLCSI